MAMASPRTVAPQLPQQLSGRTTHSLERVQNEMPETPALPPEPPEVPPEPPAAAPAPPDVAALPDEPVLPLAPACPAAPLPPAPGTRLASSSLVLPPQLTAASPTTTQRPTPNTALRIAHNLTRY
jgi:hypothetical protein